MVQSDSPAQKGGDQLTQPMQQIALSELEVEKQLVGLYRHARARTKTCCNSTDETSLGTGMCVRRASMIVDSLLQLLPATTDGPPPIVQAPIIQLPD